MGGSGLTVDALTCVPSSKVVFSAVNEIGTSVFLALAEVLNSAKVISGNGFNVLNDFLDDDGLWVSILDTFVVDSFSSTI